MADLGRGRPDPNDDPARRAYENGRAKSPSRGSNCWSERWLLSVLQNPSNVIAIVDAEGTVRYASPSIERMLGYRPRERVGTSCFDLLHPDDIPRARSTFAATLRRRGGTLPALVVRVRNQGGSWRQVEFTGKNLLDDPSVRGIAISWQDVSDHKRAEKALQESEQRFGSAFRDAAIGMALVGPDGRFLQVNRSLCRILGYPEEELLGKNFRDITHPDDLEADVEQVRKMLAGEIETYQKEKRYLHKEGHVVWVLLSVSLVHDEEGEPLYFISQVQDVTERKRSEGWVRQQAALLEQTHDAVFMWKLGGEITYWNRGAERLYGWSKEEALGRISHELLKTIHPFAPEELFYRLRREGYWEGELVHHARDDRRVVVESRHVLTHHDSEPGFVIETNRDVTERKALAERLHYQAHHDLLTDLPNRQLFLDRLGQALRRTRRRPGRKVAVLFMDLDNFKVVNDSLGHGAGDRILVTVAERLKRCVRPEDTLARFGGDEFTVFIEDVESPAGATKVAERIMQGLREPVVLDGREFFVGASIGIAVGTAPQKSPEDLLRDADTAMYQAKEEGRGYRVFEPDMYEQSVKRLTKENDLRRAIEAEEFVVHYQPIVRLDGGEVWGVEALVRWNHPELGFLNPSQFIPVAEESGLIVPVCERVLEEACRRAKDWQKEYSHMPPWHVSVNISVTQLNRTDFAEVVGGVLKRTGLEARCLCLDVTETVYVKALESDTTTLDELKGKGVRISIDDFGTGYSSLSYLKGLRADILKIDKKFIEGIGEDVEDTAIVQMVIDLAHTLGMETVAEGVESEGQAKELKRMGCDMGQGYYLSEPFPPEAVLGFLKEGLGTLDL